MRERLIVSWVGILLVAVAMAVFHQYMPDIPQCTITEVLVAMIVTYLMSGFHIVQAWIRRPIMRLGSVDKILEPGLNWVDPLFHKQYSDISTKDYVYTLSIDNLMTHDNVPIQMSLNITWNVIKERVVDFIVNVNEPSKALQYRAIAAVTNLVGGFELDSILHDRSQLQQNIEAMLIQSVRSWGIGILAVEVSDVKIVDDSIQEALAMKARATKEAQAELVRANMQTSIAGQLSEAAKAMSPEAWRLKGMETLLELCRSANNNTVIVPSNIMNGLAITPVSSWSGIAGSLSALVPGMNPSPTKANETVDEVDD